MSGCDPCKKSSIKSYASLTNINNSCGCGCGSTSDSSCIKYTGPLLQCIGSSAGDTIEDILIKVDASVCTSQGDYSGYDMACLTENETLNSQKEFVEAISQYVCDTQNQLDNYIDVVNPQIIQGLQSQITNINNPALTLCAYTGVTSSDSLIQVLVKLSSRICALDSRFDLSSIDWNQCFSVTDVPTTLSEAFNVVIDQICQIDDNGGSVPLPTFNNEGSCLPPPLTASDSLYVTIQKIRQRLCQTPTYNIDLSPWDCIENPDVGGGASLQKALDLIIASTDSLYKNRYSFDPQDFDVAGTDVNDACSGYTVSLKPLDIENVEIDFVTDSNIFNVSGAPVGAQGTINMQFNSQPVNTFFAAPESGGGTPSFRKMVTSDLPDSVITTDKIQDFPPGVLLGRYTNVPGPAETIILGNGLSLTNGGVLELDSGSSGPNFANTNLIFTNSRTHNINQFNLDLIQGGGFSYTSASGDGFGHDFGSGAFFIKHGSNYTGSIYPSYTGDFDYLLPAKSGTVALVGDWPDEVNLIEGNNITITGTYPNLTINSSGGGSPPPNTNIGNSNLTIPASTSRVLFIDPTSVLSLQSSAGTAIQWDSDNLVIRSSGIISYSSGNSSGYASNLSTDLLTSVRLHQLPDESGIIALKEDLDPLWDNQWYNMGSTTTGTEGVGIQDWEVISLGTPPLSMAPLVSTPKYKIDSIGNLNTTGSMSIEVTLETIEAHNWVTAEYKIPLTTFPTTIWDNNNIDGMLVNCDSDVDVQTMNSSTPLYSDIHSMSYVYLDKITGGLFLVGKIRLQVMEALSTPVVGLKIPIIVSLGGVVIPLKGGDGS